MKIKLLKVKNVLKTIACITVFIHSIFLSHANNVTISSVMLTGQNTSSDFSMIQFNISWDNSWRTSVSPNNWDAAWVFAKFRVGASDPTFTNVSSSGTTITLSGGATTTNLRVGMPIWVTSAVGTGVIPNNTVISSITNSTTFVISATPTTALSNASIQCNRIWEHARLNNTGHLAGSGATITSGLVDPSSAFNSTTNYATGVFLFRNTDGGGSVNFTGNQLQWNYGANGLGDNDVVSVRLFAIEMVYVPGGVDFNVGGGGSGHTSTTINTGNATTAPSGSGSLGGQAGGYPTSATNIPATSTWPNGYNAFYCMKYELSQGQYRDFLNTLTRSQQANRVASSVAQGTTTLTTRFVMENLTTFSTTRRNSLKCDASFDANLPITFYCDADNDGIGNEANDGEWIAANLLVWWDVAAFLDWSALRPMTELEYEKACRGTNAAVVGEYAHGTTSSTTPNTQTPLNAGTSSEYLTNTSGYVSTNIGNAANSRSGGCAHYAGASATRARSGATFYGILDMSGNLREMTVNISTVAGRSYRGHHGNGEIMRFAATASTIGAADVDYWPGINGNSTITNANSTFGGTTGITHGAGIGTRGGAYSQSSFDASIIGVSGTNQSASFSSARLGEVGIRGVRTQP